METEQERARALGYEWIWHPAGWAVCLRYIGDEDLDWEPVAKARYELQLLEWTKAAGQLDTELSEDDLKDEKWTYRRMLRWYQWRGRYEKRNRIT